MEKIHVYKASAGSGKTFRLALEYLKLLLSKPNAHRNILAVSFTNKATGEMKQRILGELYGMAHHCESSNVYLEILLKETGLSEEEIRKKSAKALNKILHDYGFFNIETIDSFYQRVLRNMAKELGLGAYFNIELDNQKALKEAVRALIQSLSTDTEALQWICKIIEDDAANEKYSKSIEKDLIATGKQIFEEVFKRHQTETDTFFQDKKRVDEYINTLYSRRKEAKHKFEKILDVERSRNAQNEKDQLELEINSCDLVLKHLRNMGLLSDISKHLAILNHEQNRFLLADTSALLSQLIGENDTSFLYEKIGANLNHILIDEFQDTSDLQWKNFKLLFLENLSKGYSNLIVGDVKQAIYRWRNSNWETLNSIENEFYEGATEVNTLNINYRTDSTVVNFNNAVFQKAVACLKQRFEAEISNSRQDLIEILSKAYADVCQTPKRTETKGFVEVRFVEKDGRKSQQAKTVVDTMLRLQEAKIKPEDIMILVRNKSNISKISEAFEAYLSANPDLEEDTKNYFKLVSDEAFKFSSSSAVCLIIDALRTLSNYNDPLAFAQLAYTFQSQKQPNFDQQLFDFFNSFVSVRTSVSTSPNGRPLSGVEGNGTDYRSAPVKHFQDYLPEKFIYEYRTLRKLPLYELTEKIIAIFGLFEQKNQHAFLYDFLDCVNTFVSQNSSNIEDFLEYWIDELQNKTIAINAQVSGVRILTIHKSKGLEFHTVVVPFCEWEMDETRFDQLVWHESPAIHLTPLRDRLLSEVETSDRINHHIFEQMPLIPLNYGKTLKHSYFVTDFQNETLKLWVDNLNLLYVALTRPKHNLLILAEALPKKSEKLRVSNLLHNVVNPLIDSVFQEGKLIPSVEKHEETFDGNVFRMPLKTIEVPFSIAQKQPTFYLSKDAIKWYCEMQNQPNVETHGRVSLRNNPLAKGLLYHRILAEIRYSEDIETTIEKFVFNGFISENEKITIATTIRNLLKNPIAQDWFSNRSTKCELNEVKNYRIFNECKIVNRTVRGHLEQRRPDRVMQDENGNLILVDFKTGQKYPKHHEQIQEYATLLKNMSVPAGTDLQSVPTKNPEITGFLWYLDTNEIEPVEL
ncbi:MAG: UvrD-helicase domain-containing protein [Bacteroidales bacterium]|nr:UvrD-helicase domain-containing protein [Bacteroidales bacterium]